MFFEKVEEMGHLGESWIPSSTALNIFSADATSHCAGGPPSRSHFLLALCGIYDNPIYKLTQKEKTDTPTRKRC